MQIFYNNNFIDYENNLNDPTDIQDNGDWMFYSYIYNAFCYCIFGMF